MRKIWILFIALQLGLFVAAGSLVFLAVTHPLRPYDPLYPLQDLAEQGRLRLTAGNGGKAHFAVDLVERRLGELARQRRRSRLTWRRPR